MPPPSVSEHGNARLGTKTPRRINDADDDDDLRSKSSQMIILMHEVDDYRNAAAAALMFVWSFTTMLQKKCTILYASTVGSKNQKFDSYRNIE